MVNSQAYCLVTYINLLAKINYIKFAQTKLILSDSLVGRNRDLTSRHKRLLQYVCPLSIRS